VCQFLSANSPLYSVAYLGFGEGEGHGERAERESITGVWGQSPQRSPGAEPLVGGSGAKPAEAETLFAFERSMEAANSPIFSEIRKRRKS